MTQAPPPYQPPAYQQYPGQPGTLPKRPGGLTALAVLNFVFGGLAIISIPLGLVGMKFLKSQAARGRMPPGFKMPPMPPDEVLYLGMFMALVVGVLLIVSGVGYLKVSKVAGYVFGNVYAIVSITWSAIHLGINPMARTGLGLVMCIIDLVYPVLTLILLNVRYRKVFSAPPAGPAAAGPGGGYRF